VAAIRFGVLKGEQPTPTGVGNLCLLNLSGSNVLDICAPTKVIFKMITSSYDMSQFAIPGPGLLPNYDSVAQNAKDPAQCLSGPRTGVSFEGPFIEYTVASGAADWYHPDKIRTLGVNDDQAFTYLMDVTGDRPMLFPYPGSIRMITQYPGTWTYQYHALRADPPADAKHMRNMYVDSTVRKQSPLVDDATLTLRVAGGTALTGSNRVFNRVPVGAHSMVFNNETQGDVGVPLPKLIIFQEDDHTGQELAGAGGITLTSKASLRMNLQQSTFLTRIPVNNAISGCKIQTDDVSDGYAQFHLSFQ
jgi:hypothetical protein